MEKGRKNIHQGNPGINRHYYEKLYCNKLENLAEMGKFLDALDHTKLNQEDINNVNRSVTTNEIEATIASQKTKIQDLTDSQLNLPELRKRTNTNTP
jgi:hypothetical protein